MNAYIASFMLLVFNAVGFVIPAAAAIAEEQVVPDAKSNLVQENVALKSDDLKSGYIDQCSSSNTVGSDYLGCSAWNAVALIGMSDNNVTVRAVSTRAPAPTEMADKLHIEGAP